MQKRKLGNTDIYLSAIGFGGAPIGNLFEKLDDATCYKTLECCNDFNINLYDTSPYYGYRLSEHRLGNFLKTAKINVKNAMLILDPIKNPTRKIGFSTSKPITELPVLILLLVLCMT